MNQRQSRAKLTRLNIKWTTKHFYEQFMVTHKYEPRAFQDFWSAHRVDCTTMWQHIFTSFSLGKHQCVHYRFLHRVLPTLAFMRQRFRGKGYGNLSTKCLACPNAIETNEHLFFRCTAARPILTYIYPSIRAIMDNRPFKLFKIALNIFPDQVPLPKKRMAITILQLAMHQIWTNRNSLKFDGSYPTIGESQHIIAHNFTLLLREQFDLCYPNGLVRFRKNYCHTPQICSVRADNTFHVTLI